MAPPVHTERVALGLLAALGAVVGGAVITVLIWRAGYVASITSLVIAFGATWLYTAAAGGPPRRGLIPLIVVILVGVVLSFFAVVASDLVDAYDQAVVAGLVPTISKSEFVRRGLTDSEILSEYGKDMALFGLFAVLGIFGTVRRLLASR
jgi:uncharacterized membrane protein (DUF485 family)